MDAESIVVSIGLAKKLRDSGWPQNDSVFAWGRVHYGKVREPMYGKVIGEDIAIVMLLKEAKKDKWREYVAAPTAEEILKQIPYFDLSCSLVDTDKPHYSIIVTNAMYTLPDRNKAKGISGPPPISDIAAHMWIYLKENNLLPHA